MGTWYTTYSHCVSTGWEKVALSFWVSEWFEPFREYWKENLGRKCFTGWKVTALRGLGARVMTGIKLIGLQRAVVVQSLSHIQLFAIPWIAADQASLSFTISWSLLQLMSIESVMPSNHLIFCHPLLSCLQSFPASESFPISQLLASGGQSIGASASVLPMNIQDWFPLGLAGLISLQSEGLARVFSNTRIQKHQFFHTQPSLWSNSHIHTRLLEKP